MPKSGRMQLTEEFDGASGEYPEYGAIFMSNSSTRKECLRRGLFGLPFLQAEFVKQIKAGMILFLFEFESRELHGVFQACSDGAINIEPNAFRSSGKQFPAQVKFTKKWHCGLLREHEFRDAISENYFTGNKFNFGLSKDQVRRLLSLFTLKKVERSRLTVTAAAKPTRQPESDLGNTTGGRGFGNDCAGKLDGDIDHEMAFRVTSRGDSNVNSRHFVDGRRSTENYGFRDEPDIGQEFYTTTRNEYRGDISGDRRRIVDTQMPGSKDRLGNDCGINSSFGTDASTIYPDFSLVNDQRISENTRHAAIGWSEHDNHDKDRLAQVVSTGYQSSWAKANLSNNHNDLFNVEADPLVLAQSSVSLEPLYGTNKGNSDLFDPRIMRNATMTSSRHELGAPNVDSTGSTSFIANSNYVLRENIIPRGAYVSDTLPSETVQPFHDDHYGTSNNRNSSLGLEYIPMPIKSPDYQNMTGMCNVGVACSGAVSRKLSETECRSNQFLHSPVPYIFSSAGTTDNMSNSERLSYSSPSRYPSFDYPLSSREGFSLSPKDRFHNRVSTSHRQEESEGHVSYSNNRVVQETEGLSYSSPSRYRSCAYPISSREGFNLSPNDRVNDRVSTYHRQEESEGHVSYSNDRVVQCSSMYPSFTYPSSSRDGVDMYPEKRIDNEVQAYKLGEEFGDDTFDSNNRVTRNIDRVNPVEPERKRTRRSVFSRLALPSEECDAVEDTSPDSESVDDVMAFLNDCRKHWMEPKRPNMRAPDSAGKPKKRKEKIPRTELLNNDLMPPFTEAAPDEPLAFEESMEQSAHKVPFIDFKRRSAARKGCNNPTQECKDHLKHSAPKQQKRKLLRPILIKKDLEKKRGNNDKPSENISAAQSVSEVPVHVVSGRGDQ